MVKEFIHGLTEDPMKDLGVTITCMDKEFTLGVMEEATQDST